VQLLEAKIRQRNLLADAATRYAFYDARLPQEVSNGPQFESWRRRAEPRVLHMDKADLLRADAPEINAENYPDRLTDTLDGRGALRLPLAYRYEPGEPGDGLTLSVPVAALAQLRAERYEWLVPGMLEDKIAAMLRELPGHLRRNFVPVPEWSRTAAAALAEAHRRAENRSLRDALVAHLAEQTGVEIKGDDFAEASLAPFMRMAFKVLDDTGRVLAVSRDLRQLQRKLAGETADAFIALQELEFSRDGIHTWDFGDLPESVTLQRYGMSILAFPALVAGEAACALRLLPTRHAAEAAHRAGVRRLFRLEHWRQIKTLATSLPDFPVMALKHFTLGESKRLREDLVELSIDRALFADAAPPRAQAAYASLAHVAAERLADTGIAMAKLAADILDAYHRASLALDTASRGTPAVADAREQLLHLIPPHFLLSTPFEWLEQYPRYLASLRLRLEKLESAGPAAGERDLDAMAKISPWWNQLLHRKQQHDETGFTDAELALFRWMLEEYRVHLFTQELGTVMPVSPKRLEKQWEKTRGTV
jgi:ATP-dependent helicase HrpA